MQPHEYEYAYSAWCTLFMTCMRTYARALYSENGLHRNRIRVFVSSLRIPHVVSPLSRVNLKSTQISLTGSTTVMVKVNPNTGERSALLVVLFLS